MGLFSAVRRLFDGAPPGAEGWLASLMGGRSTADVVRISEKDLLPSAEDVDVRVPHGSAPASGVSLRGAGTFELAQLADGKFERVYAVTADNVFCIDDRRVLDNGFVLADARNCESRPVSDAELRSTKLQVGASLAPFIPGAGDAPVEEILAIYPKRGEPTRLTGCSEAVLRFSRMAGGESLRS